MIAEPKNLLYGVELRPIEGVEGYYSVTKDGRVFSHFKMSFLKTSKNWLGYEQIPLGTKENPIRKIKYVHRLVAQAYLPNIEDKSDVNHIDGNKINNDVSNLEWTTRSENVQKGYDTGLISRIKVGSKWGQGRGKKVFNPNDPNKFYIARAGSVNGNC